MRIRHRFLVAGAFGSVMVALVSTLLFAPGVAASARNVSVPAGDDPILAHEVILSPTG